MSENTNKKSSGTAWGMIKLGLVLAAFAVVSCTILAVVNNFTAPKIRINQINKANALMKKIMPEADSFEPAETVLKPQNKSITLDSLYAAKKNGSTIGAVAQVTGPTYDKGTILVAVNSDGIITGMDFLELSDSPGFGLKANDPGFFLPSGKTFFGQFAGKDASKGFKAGETFDAISGATITSNGVADMLDAATTIMLDYLGGK